MGNMGGSAGKTSSILSLRRSFGMAIEWSTFCFGDRPPLIPNTGFSPILPGGGKKKCAAKDGEAECLRDGPPACGSASILLHRNGGLAIQAPNPEIRRRHCCSGFGNGSRALRTAERLQAF